MIARLSGRIIHIDSKYVILDVSGVGYKIFTTDDTLHSSKNGGEAVFWTYLAVREDALDIFGFASKKEKDFFELLIGISGIGPKGALNVLSSVSVESLMHAIQSGTTAHLVKVSGIGRKTAEKIVLELKDKIGSVETAEELRAGLSSDMDAIQALRALGYEAEEARDALKRVPSDIRDAGEKIKAALKFLG